MGESISQQASDRIEVEYEKATDWRGYCTRCKKNVVGTREQIMRHQCEGSDEDGRRTSDPAKP